MSDVLMLSSSSRGSSVAQSSPNRLLFRPSFWLSQGRFLFVCLIGAAAFILLAPYTYEHVEQFLYLVLLIQGLSMWGAYLTIKSIAVMQVEMAILDVIETRASGLLRSLKAKQIAMVELDTLEARVLPDNVTTPVPAMIRLFQNICKEARDRKFESSGNLLDPYREEPLEDLFKLQNLQKIALWLGILGTFVGLMLAIRVAIEGNSVTMDKFAGVVQSMFKDLNISFSASLAGLEVAVILGFFLLLLRKKQKLYFERMESSVITMLSLARNSLNRDDFVAEFSQVSTAMGQLTESVSAQTTVLSNRMNDLQQQIILQNSQITTGLQRLMQTGNEFDRFLSSMTDAQRQFIDDVRTVYDAVSLKRLGTTLQDTIVQAGQEMSNTIKPNVSLIGDRLAGFNQLLNNLNLTLETRELSFSNDLQDLREEVKNQTSDNKTSMETFQRKVSYDLARMPSLKQSEVDELHKNLSSLNDNVKRLNDFVSKPPDQTSDKPQTLGPKLWDRVQLALATLRRKIFWFW